MLYLIYITMKSKTRLAATLIIDQVTYNPKIIKQPNVKE